MLDAMLKCKDRLDFYLYIDVTVLVADTSDFTHCKFIAEIVIRILKKNAF